MAGTSFPERVPPSPQTRRVGGYVLVVDDHRDAADSLARLLSILGRIAQVAYDAEGALAAIERATPQLIFLDLGMPKIDGFETARRIGTRPEWRDIPLVALTGLGQERDRDRTQACGFAAHLLKPVDLILLERTLDELAPA
ncbi:MAG TPA: response regulator [Pirellulaceae bacterium]|nr:response regulator [Pirellulaceae bacterium]